MGVEHLIYISLTLVVGAFCGWRWGANAKAAELEELRRDLEQHRRQAAAARLGQATKEQ